MQGRRGKRPSTGGSAGAVIVIVAAEVLVVASLLNAQGLTDGQFRVAASGVEFQDISEMGGPGGAMGDLLISIEHEHAKDDVK